MIKQLRRLAIFAEVASKGSITKAADHLGMHKAKVSEQIKALETELGVRLFNRTTRSLSLTEIGQSIYPHASNIRNEADNIDQLVQSTQEPSGLLRISTAIDFADDYILDLIDQFCAMYPEVSLDLILTDQPVNLIEENIDVVIRTGVLKDSSLIVRTLFEAKLKLYASPEFLVNNFTPKSLNELKKLNWVSLTRLPMGPLYKFNCENTSDCQEVELWPKHQTNSPAGQKSLISRGFGVGLLADFAAKPLVEEGTVVNLFPELSLPGLVVSLLYPSRKHLPAKTRAFVEYLVENFTNPVDR